VWPFRGRTEKSPEPSETSLSPSCTTASLGARGETLARKFLRRAGMKILASNYRCAAGEADLIVLDPADRAIAFVEVKTRSRDDMTAPESAVNADKQRRLRRIARHYLARHNAEDHRVRFDVIAIVQRPGETPELRHVPDAF
jgi:putative endonuclease